MEKYNKKIKNFIHSIFNEFNKNNIEYCLLRSFDDISIQKDIDVFVSSNELDEAILILENISKKSSFFSIARKSVSQFHTHVFIFFLGSEKLDKLIIFDFQTGIIEKNTSFLSKDIILSHCCKDENNISHPKIYMQAFLIIIHCTLGKKYFKPIYWDCVLDAYNNYNQEFDEILDSLFPPEIKNVLLENIKNKDQLGLLSLYNSILYVNQSRFLYSLKNIKEFYVKIKNSILWFLFSPGIHINLESFNYNIGLKLFNIIDKPIYLLYYKSLFVNFYDLKNNQINRNIDKYFVLIINYFKIVFFLRRKGIVFTYGYRNIFLNKFNFFNKINSFNTTNINIIINKNNYFIKNNNDKVILNNKVSENEFLSIILEKLSL
tara:strand:- start:52 stop:1179 length:1128 start_codon:yes stop_codon:yes gene_type:complete